IVDGSPADEEHKRRERHKLDALLGWCEITSCRRRPLLEYFGEDAPQSCGNCDNCLGPPVTWDGTEAARKLLSAVYRTGQRFGAAHVVDVLLGNATEKVAQHRHEKLSVFGIGTELSSNGWRSVIRQLVVLGLLRSDPDRYGGLVLTEKSRPLLRGETTLRLREDRKEAAPRKKSSSLEQVAPEDEPLWEALRDCRRRIAVEQGVPPYVIFHDVTLREIATTRPTSLDALLEIGGVGRAKLDRYGERFLDVVRAHWVASADDERR